jgi:hypothetical protein
MEQIDRDVMRTHPDMHFFSGDSEDAETHRKVGAGPGAAAVWGGGIATGFGGGWWATAVQLAWCSGSHSYCRASMTQPPPAQRLPPPPTPATPCRR